MLARKEVERLLQLVLLDVHFFFKFTTFETLSINLHTVGCRADTPVVCSKLLNSSPKPGCFIAQSWLPTRGLLLTEWGILGRQ